MRPSTKNVLALEPYTCCGLHLSLRFMEELHEQLLYEEFSYFDFFPFFKKRKTSETNRMLSLILVIITAQHFMENSLRKTCLGNE